MIPELLNGASHGFPKRVNKFFLRMHNVYSDRAREMRPPAFAWAARDDRNRAGRATALDGPAEPVAARSRLFCQKLIMLSHKTGNAKAKKGETTDMEICDS